jgi:hypothetical protein
MSLMFRPDEEQANLDSLSVEAIVRSMYFEKYCGIN